jgi:hypothetical protein
MGLRLVLRMPDGPGKLLIREEVLTIHFCPCPAGAQLRQSPPV